MCNLNNITNNKYYSISTSITGRYSTTGIIDHRNWSKNHNYWNHNIIMDQNKINSILILIMEFI